MTHTCQIHRFTHTQILTYSYTHYTHIHTLTQTYSDSYSHTHYKHLPTQSPILHTHSFSHTLMLSYTDILMHNYTFPHTPSWTHTFSFGNNLHTRKERLHTWNITSSGDGLLVTLRHQNILAFLRMESFHLNSGHWKFLYKLKVMSYCWK